MLLLGIQQEYKGWYLAYYIYSVDLTTSVMEKVITGVQYLLYSSSMTNDGVCSKTFCDRHSVTFQKVGEARRALGGGGKARRMPNDVW